MYRPENPHNWPTLYVEQAANFQKSVALTFVRALTCETSLLLSASLVSARLSLCLDNGFDDRPAAAYSLLLLLLDLQVQC